MLLKIMEMLTRLWNEGSVENLVKTVLADTSIWGEDLNAIQGLADRVVYYIKQNSMSEGMLQTVKRPCRLILLLVFFNFINVSLL